MQKSVIRIPTAPILISFYHWLYKCISNKILKTLLFAQSKQQNNEQLREQNNEKFYFEQNQQQNNFYAVFWQPF